MKIKLLDYDGVSFEVDIPDDTECITGEIVSGDTVMEAPFHFDTGKNSRIANFFDGEFRIPAKNFAKMNEITNSYQLFDLEE